jgi:UDP-hydrolysing UDP-N-acetyl-D-glucosamine 2-epimerase
MIGDGWDGEPALRPDGTPDPALDPSLRDRRRVAIVTGTRAEFGLLRPVMHAVHRHPHLELAVIAAGSHLVSPAVTFREVKADFNIADTVPMQIAGRVGRGEDVESVARGIARFGRAFARLRPDWIVVLGDRIEAFAAATAGSIGGFAVAHVHGGDRAEGIADEAMRHAITKLAHVHLAATAQSAQRIVSMGERPEFVRVVGSPAVDGLAGIEPMSDSAFAELDKPDTIFLMHPVGRPDEIEEAAAGQVLAACGHRRVFALEPNLDPGRTGILRALADSSVLAARPHLARPALLALMMRLARDRGIMIGNSSAGLIEAAAMGLMVVNVGHRQSGRERAANVIDVEHEEEGQVAAGIRRALSLAGEPIQHPYGDGHAGERCAAVLAEVNPYDPRVLRKRCTY